MTAQLLIVGSGYTGSQLANAASARGVRAIRLSRSAQGTDSICADLDEPDQLAAKLRAAIRADDPLQIAYLTPPQKTGDEHATEPRLDAVLQALPCAPQRIVLASTSGVYGDCDGKPVDENSETAPQTERAIARVALENTLRHWAVAKSSSFCMLRIAGIYGPGRLRLDAIREGKPIIDPAQSGPGNRIHVDDLVSTFLTALQHSAVPQIVNVCDGDHSSSSDFTLSVARAANLPAPPIISRDQARDVFSAMRLSFLDESRVLDNRRLTDVLGVALRYPDHRDGIRASLDESSND